MVAGDDGVIVLESCTKRSIQMLISQLPIRCLKQILLDEDILFDRMGWSTDQISIDSIQRNRCSATNVMDMIYSIIIEEAGSFIYTFCFAVVILSNALTHNAAHIVSIHG